MVKKLGFLFLLAFAALAMVNCNRSSGGKNPPASSDMFALSFQHDAIDRERVYACGYSNGGMMSYALGCYLNNEIAAVASISGCLGDTSATWAADTFGTDSRKMALL